MNKVIKKGLARNGNKKPELAKLFDKWNEEERRLTYGQSLSGIFKELYNDDIVGHLVYKSNPFLKMIDKDETRKS